MIDNSRFIIHLSMIAMLWSSAALAEHPTKLKTLYDNDHAEQLQKGEELKYEGEQKIKAGKQMIHSGYPAEGKSFMLQGIEDVKEGNRLIQESKDTPPARKNIRDRDHN